MKRIGLLLSFFLSITFIGQAQSLDKLFKKYSDDYRFEYTSVGKGMLGVFSRIADYSELTDGMLQKITGLKVLRLDSEEIDPTLVASFTKDIDKIIDKGKYETTLEKRGKNSKTYIYRKVDRKLNAEYVILTNELGSTTLVWLKGKANPQYEKEREMGDDYVIK